MTTTGRGAAIEVFLSYSHKDEEFRDALVEHLAVLQRENWITVWHDRRIGAGSAWKGQIDAHLLSAGMVLLLVSPSFIASDYCYDTELKTALARHAQEGLPVIPILLRPVDWGLTPFAQFQALPHNAKPVTEWTDRDAAFRDIVSGIRETLRPAIESGAISPREWWRRPAPISWKAIGLVVVLLTFFTRVFFSIATPTAPLDASATVIVFAFWLGLCSCGKYGIEKLRRISVRQKERRAPSSTDADASL